MNEQSQNFIEVFRYTYFPFHVRPQLRAIHAYQKGKGVGDVCWRRSPQMRMQTPEIEL